MDDQPKKQIEQMQELIRMTQQLGIAGMNNQKNQKQLQQNAQIQQNLQNNLGNPLRQQLSAFNTSSLGPPPSLSQQQQLLPPSLMMPPPPLPPGGIFDPKILQLLAQQQKLQNQNQNILGNQLLLPNNLTSLNNGLSPLPNQLGIMGSMPSMASMPSMPPMPNQLSNFSNQMPNQLLGNQMPFLPNQMPQLGNLSFLPNQMPPLPFQDFATNQLLLQMLEKNNENQLQMQKQPEIQPNFLLAPFQLQEQLKEQNQQHPFNIGMQNLGNLQEKSFGPQQQPINNQMSEPFIQQNINIQSNIYPQYFGSMGQQQNKKNSNQEQKIKKRLNPKATEFKGNQQDQLRQSQKNDQNSNLHQQQKYNDQTCQLSQSLLDIINNQSNIQ